MNAVVSHLIILIIGLVIGYLDPVVLFRRFNDFCEKYIFPKLIEWRGEWRARKSTKEKILDPKPLWTEKTTTVL